jgi:hypothetical protein
VTDIISDAKDIQHDAVRLIACASSNLCNIEMHTNLVDRVNKIGYKEYIQSRAERVVSTHVLCFLDDDDIDRRNLEFYR